MEPGPASPGAPVAFTPPPAPADLERLLDAHAPFTVVPLCPSIRAFTAASLVDIWQAAEHVAGCVLPAPFWAFPWPAGIALARCLLDQPSLVRGRAVIDVGAGGGVSCFAAAQCGAARVVACDADPWALAVTRLAAARQALDIETLNADITALPSALDDFDVILSGDLAYERNSAAVERAVIGRAVSHGAIALLADAGRTYFDAAGLEPLNEYALDVVADLEGCDRRTARVFLFRSGSD